MFGKSSGKKHLKEAKMILIQILLVAFALFAFSRVFLRFKDKKMTVNEFIFWTLIWLGAAVIVILPNSLGYISKLLGISRPVDVIIYLSIAVMFYLIFKLYIKIETAEQEITKIVRERAIKKK